MEVPRLKKKHAQGACRVVLLATAKKLPRL